MGGEWKYMPFTEAVVINPRITLKRGENYPFVDMQSLDPSRPTVAPSRLREFAGGGSKFEPYDTLMARITPCLENGKIARYVPGDKHYGPAFGSTEFIVIRGREGVTDNDFAFYLTRWGEFRAFAIAQMSGSSGRQRVPVEALAGFEVLVPPLPLQRAIAHILGTLDDKIELNRKMNQTLEAIARAIFKSWFVDFDPVIDNALAAGKPIPEEFAERATRRAQLTHEKSPLPENIRRLFPDEFQDSELGPIPKGWEVGSIYKIADVIYGAPFTSVQFNSDGIGEPLIRIRDLASEAPSVWTTELHAKGYKVRPGDIVVGMDGEFRPYLWGGPEGWLNQRVCVFVPKAYWSAAFVRIAIIEPLARIEATKTGTTVIHLGKADIDRFKVVLPGREVVAFFNKICQPWYDCIVANRQESRTLTALRDVLVPKLIRGEIRVQDAERVLNGSLSP